MNIRTLVIVTLGIVGGLNIEAADKVGFIPLKLNEVKIDGWMKKQIERDITSGYISVYTDLQPTMQSNTFGPKKTKNYFIDKDGNWETRRSTWWPGEHEGYYAEIAVRNGFLTGNKDWIEKARNILDYVIENQDKSGYIGIYDEECRLDNLLNENGELWTQSRMMAALLAFYEYTGEKKYFDAAKRAVDYTISRYVTTGKTYFQQPKPNGGGLTHGLMYCETLEWMYRITGDRKYFDFAEWLYKDYSEAEPKLKNVDNQLDNLLDKDRPFLEHSVHVAEHLRVVFWLAAMSDNKDYKIAVENIFYKLKNSQSPTGIMVMDPKIHESVAGNFGSPWLPYEYCTIVESVISQSSAMQKFRISSLGDAIENVMFNAGQGARLPDGKAISYATLDNRFKALESDNFRYQVAACHKTACCNLQAAKLMAHYVSNMWMRNEDDKGIALALYGESEVNTRINGVNVNIKESTDYPFDNRVSIIVSPEESVDFILTLRNPEWSENTIVKVEDADIKKEDGWIVINKKWKAGDRVELEFDDKIHARKFINNEIYFQKGCLIYAVPVKEKMIPTKTFDGGYSNYDVLPADSVEMNVVYEKLKLQPNIDNPLRYNVKPYGFSLNPDFNPEYPYDKPYGFINVKFLQDGKKKDVKLIPIGSTVLRKVTFVEDK